MRAVPKSSRRKPCPPHGPIVIDASEGSCFVASCLGCRVVGPAREDATKAKLAFDQKWH